MKQEEKTRKTRERILAAAMVEFGTKSYETASLTAICEKDQLSKGLLYHNFKGKDALYLACVSRCYEEMTACFTSQTLDFTDASGALGQLMAQRQQFFQSHPYCANIFFGTILHPPEHLRREIEEIRQELLFLVPSAAFSAYTKGGVKPCGQENAAVIRPVGWQRDCCC